MFLKSGIQMEKSKMASKTSNFQMVLGNQFIWQNNVYPTCLVFGFPVYIQYYCVVIM